jgi:hypothetical protein
MTPQMLKIREAVAACLRAMGKAPSALLFIDGTQDWTYDLPDLFDIPVFHAVGLSCDRWGTEPDDCPFIPIGKTDGEISPTDRKRFAEAWVNPLT